MNFVVLLVLAIVLAFIASILVAVVGTKFKKSSGVKVNSLQQYLTQQHVPVTEGNIGSNEAQKNEITKILKSKPFQNILEIGFNAGHSSELFLKNTNAQVYSFDLGDHLAQYMVTGKQYIDAVFPNRHTLILGDSKKTIPKFTLDSKNMKFDLIFIDGGHDYDTAYADLKNCRQLANENTIVIMDDITLNPAMKTGWSVGPTQAWDKMIKLKLLKEIRHSDYGLPGRGQSVGTYLGV